MKPEPYKKKKYIIVNIILLLLIGFSIGTIWGISMNIPENFTIIIDTTEDVNRMVGIAENMSEQQHNCTKYENWSYNSIWKNRKLYFINNS
jgi:hypothetical protein